MKKLSLSLAVLFALSFGANSQASLMEMSDDELRDVDGLIIGGGLSQKTQSELIAKFAAGDKNAIALIAETNRMVNDARKGSITYENFRDYYFLHLRNLVNMGFNAEMLSRQADAVFSTQTNNELFENFLGQLSNVENSTTTLDLMILL